MVVVKRRVPRYRGVRWLGERDTLPSDIVYTLTKVRQPEPAAMPLLTLQPEIHTCPTNRHYRIELDPKEAVPDDPGQGTPAMVYGPNGASGTFDCVCDTGEMSMGDHEQSLPPGVLRWLESMGEYVHDYVAAACDMARVKAAEDGAAAPGMSPG